MSREFGGPFAGQLVRLARGVRGRYLPTRGGGSCAKAQVAWRQDGETYTIVLAEATRRQLEAMADQAITRPPIRPLPPPNE